MLPSEMCKRCGGLMQYVNTKLQLITCPDCKDSHGWDREAWRQERERATPKAPPPEKKEDKPQ